MLAVAAFFFLLMLGPANPFKTVQGTMFQPDGPGPNSLQNHVVVAFHPPMLYLGYVGFTVVPFADRRADHWAGRRGMAHRDPPWTLSAWGFLSVGIVLERVVELRGARLGRLSGTPSNASFLPWLAGTAYLHSVMVQEHSGMLRVWNLSLLCATFSLTSARSSRGRACSTRLHTFSESQNRGVHPHLLPRSSCSDRSGSSGGEPIV